MCGIFQTICQIIYPDKVRSECWQFKKRSKITCRKLIMENEFSLFFSSCDFIISPVQKRMRANLFSI